MYATKQKQNKTKNVFCPYCVLSVLCPKYSVFIHKFACLLYSLIKQFLPMLCSTTLEKGHTEQLSYTESGYPPKKKKTKQNNHHSLEISTHCTNFNEVLFNIYIDIHISSVLKNWEQEKKSWWKAHFTSHHIHRHLLKMESICIIVE